MSGGLPFWIIVLLCWSMSSQLITWTSSFVPVFCWYFCAKSLQNLAVLLLEYSAATSLMDEALAPLDAPLLAPAPVPPPHAERARAKAPAPTTRAVDRDLIRPPRLPPTRRGVAHDEP